MRGVAAGLLGLLVLVPNAGATVHGESTHGSRARSATSSELNAAGMGRMHPLVSPPERAAALRMAPSAASPATADGGVRPATAFEPNALAQSFDGPTTLDANAYPPDTGGDVGPQQYVVMVNGRIESYDKATGAPDGALNTDTDAFFASVMTPLAGSVTSNFTTDPHIRYDRLSGRWFAVMIDVPNQAGDIENRIMVAVSDGPVITSSTVWSFFYFDEGLSTPANGEFADYPTLGVDANALYIGTNQFSTSGGQAFLGSNAYVVQKSSVLGAGPIHVTGFPHAVAGVEQHLPVTPQGVDDPDPAASSGWFVGTDDSRFGLLELRRVDAPGSATPTLSANLPLVVPATATPRAVPQAGTGKTLDAIDTRLFSAQLRDDRIWAAHNIGVGSSGVASAAPTRDATRWYEIDVSGAGPSLVQSGTIFDSASASPAYYWMASPAANGEGAMAIGGSVSSDATHPDAWFAGRLPTDPAGTVSPPVRYTASSASYNPGNDRWGDFSLTRVDPNDDMTFWTIQEYAVGSTVWGVRVARIAAPAPAAPASASPSTVAGGRASVPVTLTGSTSGPWFDPGPGFPDRLSVSVGCGVVVDGVTFSGPTSLALDLDTTAATGGPCDVTVTNPDGQSATAPGLLAIGSATTAGGGGGGGGGGGATSTPASPAPAPAPAGTTQQAPPPAPPPPVPVVKAAARCVVPKLRGHTIRGARTLLRRAHCSLGLVKRVRSRVVRRRRIVTSAPRAGTVLRGGAVVAVRVRS